MLNVIVLQWRLISCSLEEVGWISVEHIMGALQATLQQVMFTLVFVFFLSYYPVDPAEYRRVKRRNQRRQQRQAGENNGHLQVPGSGNESSGSDSDLESIQSHVHQSYGATPHASSSRESESLMAHARRQKGYSNIPKAMRGILERHHLPLAEEIHGKVGSVQEYDLATTLAKIAFVYILVIVTVSVTLVSTHSRRHNLEHWASVLGFAGGLLAMLQYLPQIVHTARARLVRSVSILTMLVQVPGSVIFIYALSGRDGINWTSLLPYVVAAVLQGTLLILCLVWKWRQHREGIDDYGRPINSAAL